MGSFSNLVHRCCIFGTSKLSFWNSVPLTLQLQWNFEAVNFRTFSNISHIKFPSWGRNCYYFYFIWRYCVSRIAYFYLSPCALTLCSWGFLLLYIISILCCMYSLSICWNIRRVGKLKLKIYLKDYSWLWHVYLLDIFTLKQLWIYAWSWGIFSNILLLNIFFAVKWGDIRLFLISKCDRLNLIF